MTTRTEVTTALAGNGGGILRRWLDKLLCGALALVIGLVATVWAMQQGQLNQIDEEQRNRTERVIRMEQHQMDLDRRLERIENKLDVALGMIKAR